MIGTVRPLAPDAEFERLRQRLRDQLRAEHVGTQVLDPPVVDRASDNVGRERGAHLHVGRPDRLSGVEEFIVFDQAGIRVIVFGMDGEGKGASAGEPVEPCSQDGKCLKSPSTCCANLNRPCRGGGSGT